MAKKKSKGLGDDIEKITKATGIKKAATFLFGKDCGCDERKEWLNKKFPRRNPQCLVHKEYKFLDELFSVNRASLDAQTNAELYSIYNRVFNDKKKPTNCSPCVKGVMSDLRRVYNKYKEDEK